MNFMEVKVDVCYKCTRQADFICPECGSKICKYHMEFRYTGPDRGFKSRFMCPVCWLVKRMVPDDRMIKVEEKGEPPAYPSQWDVAFRPRVLEGKKK